ncbi:MAG: hypothetical protein ACI9KE_003160 [Polyangiales bacterium]|jgi:hypothetical protein
MVKSFSSGEPLAVLRAGHILPTLPVHILARHIFARHILAGLIVMVAGCGEDLHAVPGTQLDPAAITPPPEIVFAPEGARAPRNERRLFIPAFVDDPEYARGERVPSRRVVYRVSLRVPRNLGGGHSRIPPLHAELYIDVSQDRLRARFVGPGWPLPDGSEVRIRRNQPGVYVFDGAGGRPLGPGQLARWFEGGRLRREASLRVSSPPENEQIGPGALVCRFIAEWSHTSPDALERRCGAGGTPPSFRVGLWRATRTADVYVELPRTALRADHEDAPLPPAAETGRTFLAFAQFARLRTVRGARGEPEDDAPERGVVIMNTSEARMVVTIGGTPVGWIDAGAEYHFEDVEPGSYAIGAMRPLGLQTAQKRTRTVPGRVRLPR